MSNGMPPKNSGFVIVHHILRRGEMVREVFNLSTLLLPKEGDDNGLTCGTVDEDAIIGAANDVYMKRLSLLLQEAEKVARDTMMSLPDYKRYSSEYSVAFHTITPTFTA